MLINQAVFFFLGFVSHSFVHQKMNGWNLFFYAQLLPPIKVGGLNIRLIEVLRLQLIEKGFLNSIVLNKPVE
jgi:hypothetical protein